MNRLVKHKGELFVISGPSGTGKGTICKKLIEDEEIFLSVSATTREPRPGEVDGESYYFMDKDTFVDMINSGGFLEHAVVYDHYYGTPKQRVLEKLEAGIDVILEIDIQGAMNVKKSFPEGIFIFILPPSLKVLRELLTARGTDAPDVIEKRLSKTVSEIKQIGNYDYYVVNDDLDTAVERTRAIIDAERSRVSNYAEEIIGVYEREE